MRHHRMRRWWLVSARATLKRVLRGEFLVAPKLESAMVWQGQQLGAR